jgi:uncharacterized membrane protein YgdD (TMEM256/DUF423 family)
MDWGLVLALALYLLAVGIAAVRSRSEAWGPPQIAGATVFLVGAGVALFLDDAVAALDAGPTALVAWSEPIGTALMLLGGLVVWRRADLTVPTD